MTRRARVLRRLLAPLLCLPLALLCAGRLRAAEAPASPPPSAAPFRWDIPGTQSAIRVGDTLWVRGRPMTLYAVRSSWKVPELRKLLVQQFRKAKFYLPPEQAKPLPGLALSHATGVDPKTEVAYTALLQPEPDGTTTLFLGAVSGKPRQAPGTSSIAPVFPGGKHVLESNFEGMKALSYVAPGKVEELESFYRSTLARAGYTADNDGLTFRRPDNVLRLQIGPERAGTLPVVVLSSAVHPDAQLPQ